MSALGCQLKVDCQTASKPAADTGVFKKEVVLDAVRQALTPPTEDGGDKK